MKIVKWLDKNLEIVILAIMLAIMCFLSFANVIMRYFFHHALTWSDEICCYLLALSAFYCLPCAIRRGISLKVDTFTSMLPANLRKILEIICSVLMLGILFLLFKGTTGLIDKAALIHQASPALGIPVAKIYWAMGIGILLGIFRYLQLIFFLLKGKITVEADNSKDFADKEERED